ncbi:hypothetical protein Cadr_000018918 [Camelus dromedarius]|uniref:Uncharacterized protein n=1 Tax=Camelus dromedarius TaxID=9838 RepID=A0A5N4D402_CAMDR|nr:hypothetical protein Cadr_000018918 [Camelus dromedarius]
METSQVKYDYGIVRALWCLFYCCLLCLQLRIMLKDHIKSMCNV